MQTQEQRRASNARYYARHREKVNALNAAAKRRITEYINAEKLRQGCRECGFNTHAVALDFHHREGEEKSFCVAYAARYGYNLTKIATEIAKCDVLCANCHRIHHHASEAER